MNFIKRKRRRTPTVIIVSLIDVLLVVLIFLMVSTKFEEQEPSLQLTLPTSDGAAVTATESQSVIVMVTTNFPHYYVGNQALSLKQLSERLRMEASKDPEVHVDIKGDVRAEFGHVFRVIDAAKMARVGSINVITAPTGR